MRDFGGRANGAKACLRGKIRRVAMQFGRPVARLWRLHTARAVRRCIKNHELPYTSEKLCTYAWQPPGICVHQIATEHCFCAPDAPHGRPRRGHSQSGRINIGIAAGNREEYAIPQSSRNALRGRPFRPSATDWGLRRLVQHSAGHVSMGAGCVSMNLKLYGRQPCPPTRVGDSCSAGGL